MGSEIQGFALVCACFACVYCCCTLVSVYVVCAVLVATCFQGLPACCSTARRSDFTRLGRLGCLYLACCMEHVGTTRQFIIETGTPHQPVQATRPCPRAPWPRAAQLADVAVQLTPPLRGVPLAMAGVFQGFFSSSSAERGGEASETEQHSTHDQEPRARQAFEDVFVQERWIKGTRGR